MQREIIELSKEFEKETKKEKVKEIPSLEISSYIKESKSPKQKDAATPIHISKKKFKYHNFLKFKSLLSQINITPIKCIENYPGNYDKYLETTLRHIAILKKNKINFDYALENPEIHENVPKIPETDASKPSKKLLLLDLDETLIHADFCQEYKNNKSIKYDKIIKFLSDKEEEENEDEEEVFDLLERAKNLFSLERNFKLKKRKKNLEKEEINVGIFIRNGVQEFLSEVSKYFDVGIFTASVKEYADAVIDNILDPEKKFIKYRLYRNNCINVNNSFFVKNLNIIKGIDIKNVILIDNSMYSFSAQLTNGILINSFYTDKNDTDLYNVLGYLLNFALPTKDIREINEQVFNFQKITEQLIKEIENEIN